MWSSPIVVHIYSLVYCLLQDWSLVFLSSPTKKKCWGTELGILSMPNMHFTTEFWVLLWIILPNLQSGWFIEYGLLWHRLLIPPPNRRYRIHTYNHEYKHWLFFCIGWGKGAVYLIMAVLFHGPKWPWENCSDSHVMVVCFLHQPTALLGVIQDNVFYLGRLKISRNLLLPMYPTRHPSSTKGPLLRQQCLKVQLQVAPLSSHRAASKVEAWASVRSIVRPIYLWVPS